MEEYDTYVIYDDLNQEQKVPNRIKEQVARHEKSKKERKRRNILLFTVLLLLLIWVIVITALGASTGSAFSKPSYSELCNRIEYSWYVNISTCNVLVSLPDSNLSVSGARVLERTLRCDGFELTSNGDTSTTKNSVMVTNQYASRGLLNSASASIWSWEIHNFEAGLLENSVINMAGFGVEFNGAFNGSVSINGGYGSIGSSLSGSCLVSRGISEPDRLIYDMTLLTCS
mmetsp:Transcript_9726/g.17543  ORF Transcript_9726/g.17543 Transcript_9726/m.17543 type:complete len:229 (+) Transcript_9726:2323-3009(+)